MDEEKEKMKTGRKVVLALILILLILTAAAYGYGVHYFTDHFLPGSQVNGFNCSYKTAAVSYTHLTLPTILLV